MAVKCLASTGDEHWKFWKGVLDINQISCIELVCLSFSFVDSSWTFKQAVSSGTDRFVEDEKLRFISIGEYIIDDIVLLWYMSKYYVQQRYKMINFSAFAWVFDRISKQSLSCISNQKSSFAWEISNRRSWEFARNSNRRSATF